MKISQLATTVIFTAGISLFAGCDDDGPKIINSDTVSTGQVFATYQVISDGSGYVYAEAQLTHLTPPSETEEEDSFVKLVNNDELWLSTGTNLMDQKFSGDVFSELNHLSDTQTRFKASSTQTEIYDFIFFRSIINPFGNWYSAQLPQTDNLNFQISLFRDDTTEARHSNIMLPQNFSLVSPGNLDLYSRSTDDIIVEWTNTEMNLSVEIETTVACPDQTFTTYSDTISEDSGMYIIPASTIEADNLTGRCTTTINVRKALIGVIDPNFIGGLASGYQIRRTSFITKD